MLGGRDFADPAAQRTRCAGCAEHADEELIGVGSRGYLAGRLRAMVAEFQGREPAAGLLFGDVDRFKSFNDIYGHDVGDRVLRMVASTLRDNVRNDDMVGSWGGEERRAGLRDELEAEWSTSARS